MSFFQMYIVLSQCCLQLVTLLKWSAKKLDQNAPWILFYNSGLVSAWDVPCHEAEFQSSSVSYKTEHFRAVLSWFILVERPPFINTSHKLRIFPDLPFAMKLMPISKSVETIKKAPWQAKPLARPPVFVTASADRESVARSMLKRLWDSVARGWSAQRAFSSVSHAISKPAQRRLGRWQILRIVIISSVTSLRCAQTSLHHSLFPWVRVQFV